MTKRVGKSERKFLISGIRYSHSSSPSERCSDIGGVAERVSPANSGFRTPLRYTRRSLAFRRITKIDQT